MNEIVQFIVNKDTAGLRQTLSKDPGLANAGIPIPGSQDNGKLGHPLHRICDAVFKKIITDEEAIELAKALLEYGADIDGYKERGDINTPVIAAASLYAEGLALYYLEQGADFRYIEPGGGTTALHWAAICGLDRLTKLLIEKGADINVRDKTYTSTPVGWAEHAMTADDPGTLYHQKECFDLLVAAGDERG